MRSSARLRAVSVALLTLVMAGCTTNLGSLNFTTDDRLTFHSPPSRKLITEPVTLAWTIRDFTITAQGQAPPSRDGGYFAIFVDRAPVKPNESLKAVGKGDSSCEHVPGCPDAEYLAARQIYTATDTTFTLPTVRALVGLKEEIQLHEATIVLLDTAGNRIGESAWVIEFKLRKRGFA